MNIALIFAGGSGQRMNSKQKPKQLLELHGKPIIIHTLEEFEYHLKIDKIVIVSLENIIDKIEKYVRRFELKKVEKIVKGGESGFESILKGLAALEDIADDDDLVLIHDGVRPLVDEMSITNCISKAEKFGTAVTCVSVTEGIIVSEDGDTVDDFPDRKIEYATKAPQCFKYKLIYDLYKKAKEDCFIPIESAHLCHHYGIKLHMVQGSYKNIKITTGTDYYIFRAIFEAIENSQIEGY
ncbi:MAG: 2-C-methyl-D-erythritol 4-phosphate cytidylyltransferase [Lachnospirales bacterium]